MQTQITWPAGLDPKNYPVHSYNELFIPHPPEKIWEVLIDAKNWPNWYSNSKNVRLAGADKLNLNTKFEWQTFGLPVKSRVLVFNPNSDLGWDATTFAAEGFHGWKIIPKEGGCLVITEEVQRGFGPKLVGRLVHKGLVKQHQNWLIGIKNRIEKNKI